MKWLRYFYRRGRYLNIEVVGFLAVIQFVEVEEVVEVGEVVGALAVVEDVAVVEDWPAVEAAHFSAFKMLQLGSREPAGIYC